MSSQPSISSFRSLFIVVGYYPKKIAINIPFALCRGGRCGKQTNLSSHPFALDGWKLSTERAEVRAIVAVAEITNRTLAYSHFQE